MPFTHLPRRLTLVRHLAPLLLLLFGVSIPDASALEPPRTRRKLDRSEVVVNDPDHPRGMQLRRERLPGESWLLWFQDVLLWPYAADHYNRLYATLDLNGRRLQFIPNVIFEVEGEWILVVRGAHAEVEAATKRVRLDGLGSRFLLRPDRALIMDDRDDGAWLGFIFFTPPSPLPIHDSASSFDLHSTMETSAPAGAPPLRVMSSFEDFQDAGGVADILDESAVRRRYKVLRDPVEIILDRVLPGVRSNPPGSP